MKHAFTKTTLIVALCLFVLGECTTDRTITQVVKLLQNMLDKSKADGTSERELFAKHKCYCDQNEAAKKTQIASLKSQIAMFENDIDAFKASSAILSKEVGQLKADMEVNLQCRVDANATRETEKAAFEALEADLSSASVTVFEAIEVLAAIGADQTSGNAAPDHQYFMAKNPQVSMLKASVKKALIAASALVEKKDLMPVQAFLQAPFTGTYTSQSAEVIGILKDMRDTFLRNLAEARAKENQALAAHLAFLAVKQTEHETMENSYMAKQAQLSANDDGLSCTRTKLSTAETELVSAQEFLDELLELCSEKTKDYHERLVLRTQEEEAVTAAISILDSDAAFAVFGAVTATKEGPTSFLQRKEIQKHVSGHKDREQAQAVLRKAANSKHSLRLIRIAASLEANNPFAVVLAEIGKMEKIIDDEQKADEDQKAWCKSERDSNNDALSQKNSDIVQLDGEIADVTSEIDDAETGLKVMIEQTEQEMQENEENKATETKARKDENLAYQKDIENLVEAEALLGKAITVLEAYYSKIAASLITIQRGDQGPAPPTTWSGPYTGQSGNGGNDAISMLKFILSNTEQEEAEAHSAEEAAQHEYEDSMKIMKDFEDSHQITLSDLQVSLAGSEKKLLSKQEDLTATTAEKKAIQAYLLQIKPGCDFITANFDQRTANRQEEKGALSTATDLLKGTPVYQEAMAAAHNETLGKCVDICAKAEEHVDCKACLADVSVPGYCAGHAGTLGC